MTTTIYPTRIALQEPWLLDQDNLLDLNKELEESWTAMEDARHVDLQRAREEALSELRREYPDANDQRLQDLLSSPWRFHELEVSRRSCVLSLHGGARVEASTLAKALEKREVLEKRILDVRVALSSGRREVEISSRWPG